MKARELDAAEIEEIEVGHAAGLPEIEDGQTTMTAAELALFEQEEGFVSADSIDDVGEEAFQNVEGTIMKLLRTPGGKPLKVEVTDNNPSADMVNIYDNRTGQPYAVAKASLRFYLDKVNPATGQRVFGVRQNVKPAPRPYPCPATMCKPNGGRKMFATPLQAQRHYEGRHHREFVEAETARVRANEDETRQMNQNLAKVLNILVTGQSSLTPEQIQAVAEANILASLDTVPNLNWKRPRIIAWMEAQRKGWYGEDPKYASCTIAELLVHIGVLDESDLDVKAAS